jgi:AAA+ superfamily predicted ATPase
MPQTDLDALFNRRLEFPSIDAAKRLHRLVGLDDVKSRLAKTLGVLVNHHGPQNWAKKHHPDASILLDYLGRRPPLVIFAGDVGTGKTELAEVIGDAVARQEDIPITLFPLSLSTRGSGRVGEMTQLLTEAFEIVVQQASRLKGKVTSKAGGAIIMLIDEGDALTQSREATQMHHEDRAGVNAFIRGVDRLAEQHLPVVVILCTNRLSSIDPAVQRRAADIFRFARPNDAQRHAVLEAPLAEAGFSATEINKLVKLPGAMNASSVGFTFSDLTQRFLPTLVLDAYPDRPITFHRAVELLGTILATPQFLEK